MTLSDARHNVSYHKSQLKAAFFISNMREERVDICIDLYFEAVDKLRAIELKEGMRLTYPYVNPSAAKMNKVVELLKKYQP